MCTYQTETYPLNANRGINYFFNKYFTSYFGNYEVTVVASHSFVYKLEAELCLSRRPGSLQTQQFTSTLDAYNTNNPREL